jgi:tetratricopeptide (TPR) repeat protein
MKSSKDDGPYPGPQPFSQGDREVFFGRADEARLLAEWWQKTSLTYLVGPTGRGKTSLLHAGILPLLTDRKLRVLPVGRVSFGASFPSAALPQHNPYTVALLRSWSAGESATKLAGVSIRDFVGTLAGNGPILAAIDPIDELGRTGPRQRHRREFLAELEDALLSVPRLHLLVVGREPTVGVAAKVLGSGLRREIAPLSSRQAADAISGPMDEAGRRFADGAVQRLVKNLTTSRLAGQNGAEEYRTTSDTVEPVLLQVTCARLWGLLPPDGSPVTAQDVRGYGDVDQALTAWTSSVVSEVAEDYDLSFTRLASWLATAFITEIGTRHKQYEGVSTTAQMPNALAATLEDRHLLTSSVQSGSRWYELISDRLVEPVRQVGSGGSGYQAIERPGDGLSSRLLAAERALAAGELDLAERRATALQEVAESKGQSTAENFAFLGKAYSLLGNVACEHARSRDAEKKYSEAMRYFGAASDNQAAGYQLTAIGHLLLEQGRTGEAVKALESALNRLRSDLVVRVFYATALWQLGECRAAVSVLNEALSIDGDHADALQTRGEILADLGDAREALRDLDRVPDAGRPSTRAARGLALAELGEQQAARREIEKAISSGERSGPALLYAARAFALIGDQSAAEENARLAADATDPPLSRRQRETARTFAGQGG